MAPCNGTTSTPPKSPSPPTIHHVHSPKVGRNPPLAHYNGTLQWHPAMAPRPLPQSWSSTPPPPTLQWQCAMAPSNSTTSTAPCNGTLVPRPISQSGSSPSPPIGSKNPYSYRYLGNDQLEGVLGRDDPTKIAEESAPKKLGGWKNYLSCPP